MALLKNGTIQSFSNGTVTNGSPKKDRNLLQKVPASWKPILPSRLSSHTPPSPKDVAAWVKSMDEVRKHGERMYRAPVLDFDAIDDPSVEMEMDIEGYGTIEYQGKAFKAPQEEDWKNLFLKRLKEDAVRYEQDDEVPYHFQQIALDADSIRELDKLTMFDVNMDDGALVNPGSSTKPAGGAEEDLLSLLYGDMALSEDEEDNEDDTASVVAPSIASGRSVAPRNYLYERFYDFNKDFEYDEHLAAYFAKDQLLESVSANRVTIVIGTTGTGKTTQIPLYLLDSIARTGQPCNLVVTQPRRLAAVTNAVRAGSRRKDRYGRSWKLGGLVGFHVGLSKRTTRKTRLTYCTTAIFLKTIGSDLNLNRFTHVILDEVHERDQDTDLSLMLIKKMMLENSPRTKLIIMSATMDLEKISQYFSDADPSLVPAVVTLGRHLNQQSSPHRIDEFYLDQIWRKYYPDEVLPVFDYSEPVIQRSIFRLVINIIADLPDNSALHDGYVSSIEQHQSFGSVLVFLPGMSDIQDYMKNLREEAKRNGCNWEVMGLHSTMSSEGQTAIMQLPSPRVRRIILSTNIAESSITIPYVVFVIDLGLTKRLIMDKQLDLPRLALQWASKANMIQRKGRVGRVQRGVYFCMLSKEFWDTLADHELPDMTISPIHHSILHVRILNLPRAFKPHEIFALLLDPPSRNTVTTGILQLKEVGALSLFMDGEVSVDDGEVTKLGRILERLPIGINLGRLIVLSYVFGALEDGITLAAGLSIRNIFLTSAGYSEAASKWIDKRLLYGINRESDCLAILSAYDKYRLAATGSDTEPSFGGNEERWCYNNLLSMQRMREMIHLRRELWMRLEQVGLVSEDPEIKAVETNSEERDDIVRLLIAGSFYPFYFHQLPIDAKDAADELPYSDPQLSVLLTHLPLYQGPLYENQILKLLPQQLHSDIPPKILYQQDKAYLNFSRHTLTDVSGVCRGVQLAMSIRRDEKMDAFKVVEPPGHYIPLMQSQEAKWSTVTVSPFMLIKTPDRNPPIVGPHSPPPYSQKVDVIVSSVLSPSRLFVQSANAILQGHFKTFLGKLDDCKRRQPPLPYVRDLRLGDYVLARDPDGIIHRVQVVSALSPEGDVFLVFLVDWGKYATYRIEWMRQMPQDIAEPSAFALEFNFAQVRVRDFLLEDVYCYLLGTFGMSREQKDRGTRACYIKVYSVLDSVIRGTLYVKSEATGFNEASLNDELVALGFAFPSLESHPSEHAHRNQSYDRAYGPKEFAVAVPELSYRNHRTTLKGPLSPLIANFRAIISQLDESLVRCSSDSVCSHILDGNPENSRIARILVATSVEKSEKADAVVLRNVTVLPRQPGLLGVLLTLFAPCIQLKSNQSGGYTGAIAGLGFGPSPDGKKALAIYPDHDVKAQFDTLMTPVDVEMIDNLRDMINGILTGVNLTKAGAKQNISGQKPIQKSCRKFLFNLITRPRKLALVKDNAPKPGWSLKDPLWEASCSQGKNMDNLLQPVYAAVIPDLDETARKDKTREELWELRLEGVRSLLDGSYKWSDTIQRICSLCNARMERRQDIAHHLHSSVHIAREKQLEDDWA